MPLITFGSNSKLKLKIPSKGDTNWSEDFKTYFVDPIVEHDHSGIDGRGKQLTANAIEDKAIGPEHINFGLTDLSDVSASGLDSGKYLKYENNRWQAADVDQAQTTISNAGSGVDSIGDDETGIGLGPNSEIFIEDVQGGDSLDFSQRESGTIVGVTFVIDSATTDGKSAIFNNLKECVIISNIDIEVQGQLDKCIIIMENDETTPGSVGCNLTLSGSINGATEEFFLVKSSRILSDTIEVINGSDQINVLFLDSEVKTKRLNFQLNAGSNGNYSRITRSNVEVTEKITNSKDLTTLSGVKKLQLIGSKVSTPLFQHLVGGSLTNYTLTNAFIDVDDESELKQVATAFTKIWKNADNRWNYVMSPSGINKLISADAQGVPSEFSLTQGRLLKGGANGFESHQHILDNIDNVNITNLTDGQVLEYDNSNSKWINTTPVTSQINLYNGVEVTLTHNESNGYIVRYEPDNKRFVKDYPYVPILLDPSCYNFGTITTSAPSDSSSSTHTHTIALTNPTPGNLTKSVPTYRYDSGGGTTLYWETSYADSEIIIAKPGEIIVIEEIGVSIIGSFGACVVETVKYANDTGTIYSSRSDYIAAQVGISSGTISTITNYSRLNLGGTQLATSFSTGLSAKTYYVLGTGTPNAPLGAATWVNHGDNSTYTFDWKRSRYNNDPLGFSYHDKIDNEAYYDHTVNQERWEVTNSNFSLDGLSSLSTYFPYGGKIFLRFGSNRASGGEGISGTMKYKVYKAFNLFPRYL